MNKVIDLQNYKQQKELEITLVDEKGVIIAKISCKNQKEKETQVKELRESEMYQGLPFFALFF